MRLEVKPLVRLEVKPLVTIGETRGSLSILNALVTDPDFDLSIDLLVEKFGFTSEQILNGK